MHLPIAHHNNVHKCAASWLLTMAVTTLLATAPLRIAADELVVNGGFEEPNLADMGIVNAQGAYSGEREH